MPDPTDHHTQAEHWLAQAEANVATYTDPDPDPAVLALIGIGHALLALAAPRAEPPPSPFARGGVIVGGRSSLRFCAACRRTDDDLIHNETDRDGYHPFRTTT